MRPPGASSEESLKGAITTTGNLIRDVGRPGGGEVRLHAMEADRLLKDVGRPRRGKCALLVCWANRLLAVPTSDGLSGTQKPVSGEGPTDYMGAGGSRFERLPLRRSQRL